MPRRSLTLWLTPRRRATRSRRCRGPLRNRKPASAGRSRSAARRVAPERLAEADVVALEAEHALLRYAACTPLRRVAGHARRHGPPLRGAIHLGWRLATESGVRADMVEVDDPAVTLGLLRSPRFGRRELQLTEVPVHPLVATIVLRAGRARSDQPDSERK